MKTLMRGSGTKVVPTGLVNRLTPFENPGPAMLRLRDEFERLVHGLFRDFPPAAAFDAEVRGLALEVENEDDLVRVRAELPGFEPGDFDLRVEEGRLVIRAVKAAAVKGEVGGLDEYPERECCEVVILPPGIDTGKVTARYHSGLLTVVLPKTDVTKAKRVPVVAG